MGKSTIITYSATGNSLEVAKLLDGDVVFLNETAEIPEKTEILGFVFPTYAFSLPYPVRTFIREKVKARDNSDIKYVYSIITCAGLPGFVKSDLEKELADAGLALSYVKTVKMPDAYLPLKKKAVGEEERDRIFENAKAKVEEYKKEIEDESIALPGRGLLFRLFRKHLDLLFPPGENKGLAVGNECTLCGKCRTLCPTGNIKVEENRVAIGDKCLSCFACYHSCPCGAIKYKGAEGQYKMLDEADLIRRRMGK